MESQFIKLTSPRFYDQYRSLQRIAQIGVWELRLSDGRLLWSEEAYRIFDMPRAAQAPTKEGWLSLIHREDAGKFAAAMEQGLSGSSQLNISYRIIRADGAVRYIEQRAQNYIDECGESVLMGTIRDVTDRMLEAERLQKTESMLQFATAMIRVGAWEMEAGAGSVIWSDEVCDMLEMPRGTRLQMEESIHYYVPAFRDKVRMVFEQCLFHGKPFDEILQIQTAGGKLLWVRVMGRAVYGRDGRVLKIGGAFQDITGQKNAEEDAIRTAHRLINTLESITDAFFTLDRDWKFTYLNAQAEHLLKRPRREVLGKRIWDEFKEAVGSTFYHQYHRALQDQCVTTFEEFYAPLCTWFEVRAYPSDDGLAVYFRDVTERRQTQQALLESEERFKIVSKATSDTIWDWDLKTDSIWWNNSMETLFGFDPDELERSSESWTSRIHSLDKDRVLQSIHAVIDGQEEKWSEEYRFLCKDGTYAHVLDRGYVIRASTGEATRMVGCMTDLTMQKKSEQEIHALAFYDTLTGLPNRRFLLERLNARLPAGASRGRNGALLFVDLDNFKALNDTYGHDQGDELLRQVGKRIASCVRNSDIVARLGGDEFVVMLETLDESLAEAMCHSELVAGKVQQAFGQSFRIANTEIYTTPSIGIALFESNESPLELLKRADLAMYEAKAEGRNTVCIYNPEMELQMSAKVQLEADMRHGLQENEFLLHFQFQVNDQGAVVGAEVLTRWKHPARGMVPPSEFIAMAEETGLIVPLGQWILRAACKKLVEWEATPALARLTLAVNVSARQFHHPAFVESVIAILRETGADAALLELELTESILVDDMEGTVSKMTALKAYGIRFSLDDFGTGYSSLRYLQRLPIQKLKIDQSFVRDMLANPGNAMIVRTIVSLGRNLGLEVVAEGVETSEQRDFLLKHACDVFQGYFFGHPLPALEFERLLRSA